MENSVQKVFLKGVAMATAMVVLAGSVLIPQTKGKAENGKINPDDLKEGMSYFEVDEASKTYEESDYYKSAVKTLGIANGFHIVAFTAANMDAHTNGNMLVKEAVFNSNAGTKGISSEVSYIEKCSNTNAFEPMNSASSLLVVGYSNIIGLTDGNTTFTINGAKLNNPKSLASDTSDMKYVDMDLVKEQVVSISEQLRHLEDTIPAANISLSTTTGYDRNNRYINISDASGMNVYNIDSGEMTEMDPPIYIGGFEEGMIGTLVLNIDLKGYKDYNVAAPMKMVVGGETIVNTERTTWEYGKILYNFYDSSSEDGMYYGKISFNGVAIGTVLAPCADITINQNLDGNIIGDTVTIHAQTHRCDFTGILPGIKLVEHAEQKNEVTYTVEYYYENDEGEFDKEQTISTRTGVSGETVSVTEDDKIPSKEGYIYDQNNKQTVIQEVANLDGTTTLKIYFVHDKSGAEETSSTGQGVTEKETTKPSDTEETSSTEQGVTEKETTKPSGAEETSSTGQGVTEKETTKPSGAEETSSTEQRVTEKETTKPSGAEETSSTEQGVTEKETTKPSDAEEISNTGQGVTEKETTKPSGAEETSSTGQGVTEKETTKPSDAEETSSTEQGVTEKETTKPSDAEEISNTGQGVTEKETTKPSDAEEISNTGQGVTDKETAKMSDLEVISADSEDREQETLKQNVVETLTSELDSTGYEEVALSEQNNGESANKSVATIRTGDTVNMALITLLVVSGMVAGIVIVGKRRNFAREDR
jgi:hypothetical protein